MAIPAMGPAESDEALVSEAGDGLAADAVTLWMSTVAPTSATTAATKEEDLSEAATESVVMLL